MVLAAWTAVAGQDTSFRVRLYSIHQEHSARITARSGTLLWRSCRRCSGNQTGELSLEAIGNRVEAGGHEFEQVMVEGDVQIRPQEGLMTGLHGRLEVTADHEMLRIVAEIPVEDYVAAVLQGESGSFRQSESLKAMAVAIRTYAVRFRSRHAAEGFDLCDSTHCQTLILSAMAPRVQAAAASTHGQLLWFEGLPAATYYHQNCGGTVAAGQEVWPVVRAPYLRSHDDAYCRRAGLLLWKAEFSRQELERALRNESLNVPAGWKTLEVSTRTESGRARRLQFRGGRQPGLVSASSLRFAIGRSMGWNRIRSDFYEIENTETTVIFRGRGAGHGVGLCQAGAEQMAAEGKSYHDILQFYYPGTSLGLTAQGLNWEKTEGRNIELLTTDLKHDQPLLADAEKELAEAEGDLGWTLDTKIQLKVFPSIDAYRNSTGQPGWIAAYIRGTNVSLQPAAELRSRGVLGSTLRHEMVHLLVEARAHEGTPLWFREGLTLYLAEPEKGTTARPIPDQEIETALQSTEDREKLQRAYSAARRRVQLLIQKNGRATVLQWLGSGLPATSQPSQH